MRRWRPPDKKEDALPSQGSAIEKPESTKERLKLIAKRDGWQALQGLIGRIFLMAAPPPPQRTFGPPVSRRSQRKARH
jgi:hypothetical protein